MLQNAIPNPSPKRFERKILFARTLETLFNNGLRALSRRQCLILLDRLFPPPIDVENWKKFHASRSRFIDEAVGDHLKDSVVRKTFEGVRDVPKLRSVFRWEWGDSLDENRVNDAAYQIVQQQPALRNQEGECSTYVVRSFAAELDLDDEPLRILNKALWNSQIFLDGAFQHSRQTQKWKSCPQQESPTSEEKLFTHKMYRTVSIHGWTVGISDTKNWTFFICGFLDCAGFLVKDHIERHNAWFQRIPENKASGYDLLMPDLVDWKERPPGWPPEAYRNS